MMSITVYDTAPDGFAPSVEVAAIYVDVDGKILLLQLADHKSESGSWGVPAGKLEPQEEPIHAARRELFEETDIDIAQEKFQSLGALYMRKPGIDYVYHLFSVSLKAMPALSLSIEHCAYAWVSREEAATLSLMNGAKPALEVYYDRKNCI